MVHHPMILLPEVNVVTKGTVGVPAFSGPPGNWCSWTGVG